MTASGVTAAGHGWGGSCCCSSRRKSLRFRTAIAMIVSAPVVAAAASSGRPAERKSRAMSYRRSTICSGVFGHDLGA